MVILAYLAETGGYNDEHRQDGHVTYPIRILLPGRPPAASLPVVQILDQPKAPEEMPRGEIQAPTEYVGALLAAKYVCAGMSAATLKAYWDDARSRPVKTHWHPQARLVRF